MPTDRAGKLLEDVKSVTFEATYPDFRFTFISRQVEAMFGYPAERWEESGFWASLVHPDDRDGAVAFCTAQTAVGRDHEFDYRMIRADGKTIWIRDSVTVSDLPDGQRVLRGVMVDITRLREIENELSETRRAAEEANRAKSQFVASIGHELRTPLTGIMGMTQLMRLKGIPQEFRHMLGTIEQSSEVLLALIDDILTLSRGWDGETRLRPDWFLLRELVASLRTLHEPDAERRALAFSIRIDGGAEGEFHADMLRLKQVASNLISNALKYTRRGSVAVLLSRSDDGLILKVADTGIGMAPDFAARAFDPFEQEVPTDDTEKGLGLGLTIVRQLLRVMDGSVDIETEPGKGTVVTVEIPMSYRGAVRLVDETPARRVLLADDNSTDATVLAEMLHVMGYRTVSVSNGTQAVERVKSEDFDLAILDIRMPGIDGLETARAIRSFEAEEQRPALPLLGVSVLAGRDDVLASLGAGMDAHLAKPLRIDILGDAIARLLDPERKISKA